MNQLHQLIARLNDAANVLQKQAPIVAHQIVYNAIAFDVYQTVCMFIAAASFLIMSKAFHSACNRYLDNKKIMCPSANWDFTDVSERLLFPFIAFGVIGLFISILFIIALVTNAWDIYQAVHFPQLYIIQYLKSN